MEKFVHVNLVKDDNMVVTREWRKALKAQPAYRIVNRTIKGQTLFIYIVGLTGLFLLMYLYANSSRGGSSNMLSTSSYNYTYPLSRPIKNRYEHIFRIGIIADLDTNSKSQKDKNKWISYFKTGYLTYNLNTYSVKIDWDGKNEIIETSYSLKGRGMELSELVTFDGRLLSFDDRTGIIFELLNNKAVPWVLLMDGDGKNQKGFKSEWATVKDNQLYIGSMGKEWTTANGEFENSNPQFIKVVSRNGLVNHMNWREQYNKIRAAIGIYWPGYMIHESGAWSNVHEKWFFLPRRCSKEPYNESLDEHRGCSVLISANADFSDIKVVKISNSRPTRGFSSFKFAPSSSDFVIIALRTEELEGKSSTYITAFTIDGLVLLDDTFIENIKYEGFEFI